MEQLKDPVGNFVCALYDPSVLVSVVFGTVLLDLTYTTQKNPEIMLLPFQ